jgi:Putative Ig domain
MSYRVNAARPPGLGALLCVFAAMGLTGSLNANAEAELAISGSPPTSVVAGDRYSFTPAVSGWGDRYVRFSISNKPSWASFSTKTGELSGTPSTANMGTFANIAISAHNRSASAALAPFSIKVSAASSSATPTISGTPATSVTVGSTYSFQPKASDSDGAAISFSVQNKPSWASFSIASGMLSGTPTSAQVGSYSDIVISASDGTASAALPAFAIKVNPASSSTPPASGSATLTWTVPTTNTNGTALTDLAGFYVYYGTSQSELSQTVQVASPADTSYTVANLAAGTWYFAVTAYASDGTQSARSNVESAAVQ